MEELIERFGTLAIFLGAGIEGDASAIVGGVVAHLRFLSFPAALVAATPQPPNAVTLLPAPQPSISS